MLIFPSLFVVFLLYSMGVGLVFFTFKWSYETREGGWWRIVIYLGCAVSCIVDVCCVNGAYDLKSTFEETADGAGSWFSGCASIINFVLDSISLRKGSNMIYCPICSFQPMEIYVDDEAKLTLHGLVQVLYPCMLITFCSEEKMLIICFVLLVFLILLAYLS